MEKWDEIKEREIKWRMNRINAKDCEACGMKKEHGRNNLKCLLCGMGIHGKPKVLQENNKFLKFCCDTCSLKYLESSW